MTVFTRRSALALIGSTLAGLVPGSVSRAAWATDDPTVSKCTDHELLGSSSPPYFRRSLYESSKFVVRLVWEKGNKGATGVILGQGWILTAGHNCSYVETFCVGQTAIVGFDEGNTPQMRSYLVLRPDLGFIPGDSQIPGLDFLLCKYSAAFPKASKDIDRSIIRGVKLPRASTSGHDRPVAYDAFAVGHPQSNCGIFQRNGAFKAFRDVAVWHRSALNSDAGLDTGTIFCPSSSGSPVFDRSGGLIGIVSQFEARNDLPQIVTVEAIQEYLIKSRRVSDVPSFASELSIANVSLSTKLPVAADCKLPNEEIANYTADFEEERIPVVVSGAMKRVIRCVAYVTRLGREVEESGTCFLIGSDWVLTAKHVVDSPANAAIMCANFSLMNKSDFKDKDLLAKKIPFRAEQYFSSDDRVYSYDGKESVLDYALIRLDTTSPHYSEIATAGYLTAAVASEQLPASIQIPQHRQETGKVPLMRVKRIYLPISPTLSRLGVRKDGYVHDNVLLMHDTRRLYYAAAVNSGASGAPILNAANQVIGIHTNGREDNCSAAILPNLRDSGCPAVPEWERHRLRSSEQLSFGSKLTAIAQDLSFRHQLDISKIEGLSGLLPFLDREAFQGATNK